MSFTASRGWFVDAGVVTDYQPDLEILYCVGVRLEFFGGWKTSTLSSHTGTILVGLVWSVGETRAYFFLLRSFSVAYPEIDPLHWKTSGCLDLHLLAV
jgi:hypothetical protein